MRRQLVLERDAMARPPFPREDSRLDVGADAGVQRQGLVHAKASRLIAARKRAETGSRATCRPPVTCRTPPLHTQSTARAPVKIQASRISSSARPASHGESRSSETRSAKAPLGYPPAISPQGLRAARRGAFVERASRRAAGARQHVALAARQTLRIFELRKLRRRADLYVGVAADAERAPAPRNRSALKIPSPRLASVIGQRPTTAPLAASARASPSSMCVAWIEAPAPIDGRVIEEPAHGPRARPRHAILDLLDLLGDMDVDRPVAGERDDGRRAPPASTARSECGATPTTSAPAARQSSRSSREAVEIGDETALLGPRRRAAEGRMGVEHRQQGQPDARVLAAAAMRSASSARRA